MWHGASSCHREWDEKNYRKQRLSDDLDPSEWACHSQIVTEVIIDMPPDPTDSEDMIHAALFSGQMEEVLRHSLQLDCWLSAHFADLMEALELISPTVNEEYVLIANYFPSWFSIAYFSSGLSLREQYILSYADYLHSDPALWRITVDYMYSCGDVGKSRADEVLLRVPLKLQEQNSDRQINSRIRAGDVVGVLKDVNKTCFQYRRENVRRTVCRVGVVLYIWRWSCLKYI